MKMLSIVVTSGAPESAGIFANPTFAAAVCTAVFALFGALAAVYITKRSKDQELFLNALNFLTGGTQKRSVGIAIITDYAERRGMKSVATLIFNAQKKHLEDEKHHTKSPKRSIEKFNYEQMEKIIKHWEEYEKYKDTWWKMRPWRNRHTALRITFESTLDEEKVQTLDGKLLFKNGKIEMEFAIKARTTDELEQALENISDLRNGAAFARASGPSNPTKPSSDSASEEAGPL